MTCVPGCWWSRYFNESIIDQGTAYRYAAVPTANCIIIPQMFPRFLCCQGQFCRINCNLHALWFENGRCVSGFPRGDPRSAAARLAPDPHPPRPRSCGPAILPQGAAAAYLRPARRSNRPVRPARLGTYAVVVRTRGNNIVELLIMNHRYIYIDV
jgi:hypothetical protein